MKTILVPTDFSDSSRAASDFAATLAKKKEAELCFIHVVEIPSNPESVYYLNHELIQDMMSEAQKKLGELSSLYNDVKDVKTFVTTSSALDGIKKGILSMDADLIVVGKHIRSNSLGEFLLDNHTEKIIQYANCPVISVSPNNTLGEWKKAIIAIDPGSCSDEFLIKTYTISKALGLYPNYLWVTSKDSPHSQEELALFADTLHDHIKKGDFNFETYEAENIANGILDFASKTDPDLIIAGTHGRKGVNKLLYGSIAQSLVKMSGFPTMIFQLDRLLTPNSKKIVA
jgi:nucleotide-binding universal stress UspA family protein